MSSKQLKKKVQKKIEIFDWYITAIAIVAEDTKLKKDVQQTLNKTLNNPNAESQRKWKEVIWKECEEATGMNKVA